LGCTLGIVGDFSICFVVFRPMKGEGEIEIEYFGYQEFSKSPKISKI
jgi:hypothetical protein